MPSGIYDRSTSKPRTSESVAKAAASLKKRWSKGDSTPHPLKGRPKSLAHREAIKAAANTPSRRQKMTDAHATSPRISCVRCKRVFKERAFTYHVKKCLLNCDICARPNYLRSLCKFHYNLTRKAEANGWDSSVLINLWERAAGHCEICGNEIIETGSVERVWLVACLDHDHVTNLPRGYLCQTCNSLLGYARDEVQRLLSAAQYLQTHCGMSA